MFSSKLVALAVVAAGVVNAQLPPCIRTYEVQAGDTCDKIADSQGVSSFQIAAVNPLTVINAECSNLWVGQIICLAREGFDCSPVVTVSEGDTCVSIATAAGITYAKVLENNPNVNEFCSNIYPGLVLCTQA
ncbi:hypothetical protein CC2G_011110 [Coprinopsis cinerea AmutBmut pab1-1]|nr:hypothetical protein CC2G_011110 [Coprinopsis cinerea AmutBmut pab1-1]